MEENKIIWSIAGVSRDLGDTQWLDLAPVTATMMQEESVALVDTEEEDPSMAGEHSAVVVFVPSSASGWDADIVQVHDEKKYFFRHTSEPGSFYAPGTNLLVYEALQEEIGLPEEVVASTPPWPKLWHLEEAQPGSWRGVFYPIYHRKVLFSKMMTFKTDTLPRWKPNTTFQIRTSESQDD